MELGRTETPWSDIEAHALCGAWVFCLFYKNRGQAGRIRRLKMENKAYVHSDTPGLIRATSTGFSLGCALVERRVCHPETWSTSFTHMAETATNSLLLA